MVYKFFDKKSSRCGIVTKSATKPNYQLGNELYKPLENSKEEKFTHFLETIFGVLI